MSIYQPITYTAEESQSDFIIPFGYTKPSDVGIKVNGENKDIGVDFNIIDGVASFVTPLNNGDNVVISRNTNIGNTTTIPLLNNGERLTENSINKVINNVVYAAQEISETDSASLMRANNLSDVSSVVNARLNLSVHDTTTADSYYNTLASKNYNLGDLSHIQTARTNLDVYSKSEVDNLISSSLSSVSLPSNGRLLLADYSGSQIANFALFLDPYSNKKINLVPVDGNLVSLNNKIYCFNGTSLTTSSLSNSTLYHVYLSIDEDGGYLLQLVAAGTHPLDTVPVFLGGNHDSLLVGGIYTSSNYASNGIIRVGSIFNTYVTGQSFPSGHTYTDDDYIIGCGSSHVNILALVSMVSHTIPEDANSPFGGIEYKGIGSPAPTVIGPNYLSIYMGIKSNGPEIQVGDDIDTGFPDSSTITAHYGQISTSHCSLYRLAPGLIQGGEITSNVCYEDAASFSPGYSGFGYKLYSISRTLLSSAINVIPHE